MVVNLTYYFIPLRKNNSKAQTRMRNEMDVSCECKKNVLSTNIIRPTSSLVVIHAGVNAGEGLRKL